MNLSSVGMPRHRSSGCSALILNEYLKRRMEAVGETGIALNSVVKADNDELWPSAVEHN